MVEVRVLSDRIALFDAFADVAAWAEDLHLAYAWVGSGSGQADHWRALPLDRVRRAIVGTSFSQTEPAALRALAKLGVLRVVEGAGVFHPKVVVGVRANSVQVIVGSSNFTTGGFASNVELNILLSGSTADDSVVDVMTFLDAQWSSPRAFVPDDAWFARYEILYEQRPKVWVPRVAPPRKPTSSVAVGPRARYVESANELDVSWPRFVQLIRGRHRQRLWNGWQIHVFDHHVGGSFLQEVEACGAAFKGEPRYAAMPTEDRKLVAGWGDRTHGYYGRMAGAGTFKNLTLEKPAVLAKHLDRIPLVGPVTHAQARAYLEGVTKNTGVGVGTATRLLSMKRPDLFLSANNASFSNIKKVFGTRPDSVDKYMTLSERIWQLPWASAARPAAADERRIWAARVALLDAILYEPTG